MDLDFQYQYPQAFYLLLFLPLALLLFFSYRSWKKRKLKLLGNPELAKSLTKNHSSRKSSFKFFLILAAFALGCLALANPRKRDDSSAELRKGIDLVIALDISNSMLATDVSPNRLSLAKSFINNLLNRVKDDRVGIVLFAGTSYLQMPLSFDKGAAKMYVATANPGTITQQGTSISDALKKAQVAFGEEAERFGSVILITDGETHDEEAEETVKELAGRGIMVNSIGLGSPQGTSIPDSSGRPRKDEAGNVVVSKLNEKLLQDIARPTNGIYHHLQNAEEGVKVILDQYTNIEKKALADSSLFVFEPYYHLFLAPMILFLLIELFVTDRKREKA